MAELHLTFDTSVSVYVDLNTEELANITGLTQVELEELNDRELWLLMSEDKYHNTLIDNGRAEFQRSKRMAVSRGDIELAEAEVY